MGKKSPLMSVLEEQSIGAQYLYTGALCGAGLGAVCWELHWTPHVAGLSSWFQPAEPCGSAQGCVCQAAEGCGHKGMCCGLGCVLGLPCLEQPVLLLGSPHCSTDALASFLLLPEIFYLTQHWARANQILGTPCLPVPLWCLLPVCPISPNTLVHDFVSRWSVVLPAKPFCLLSPAGNIPHSFWVSLRSVSSKFLFHLYGPCSTFISMLSFAWGDERTTCSSWCDLLASDLISKKEGYFALSGFLFPDLSCIQSCLICGFPEKAVDRGSHACNGVQHSCWGSKKSVQGKIWIFLGVFQRQTALEMLIYYYYF